MFKYRPSAKVAWVVACIAVLGLFLIVFHIEGRKTEAEWILSVMLLLGFPASLLGFLCNMVINAVLFYYSIDIVIGRPGVWPYIFTWFVLFTFGYLQWFWLTPRIVRDFRRAKRERDILRSKFK